MSRFKMATFLLGFLLLTNTSAVNFDIKKTVSKIEPSQITGTCLPIWNYTSDYESMKDGLKFSRYAVLRFPNGSLSNNYHWNSTGTFDSVKIWHPDTVNWTGGFQCVNVYNGTKNGNRYSRALDGDTNSMWWSDPEITESDPYIYVKFNSSTTVDSVVIFWGNHYSSRYDVQVWDGAVGYPGPHQDVTDEWKTVVTDSSATGGVSKLKFTPVSTYALRIISRKEVPDHDIQIRELYAYSSGNRVTVNSANSSTQTQIFALSTHPGVKKAGTYDWTFETFMNYVNTLGYPSIPIICTNYGTGTSDEAAAWVYYANKVKKFNIRYWQVGNEMDGEWELGGPVNAFTYAEKFLKFSKAMKAVDSTIKVLGPVVSSPKTLELTSGEYNGKSWMESFIEKIGEAEKKDNKKYLDGIDFHSYPYWFSSTPSVTGMLNGSDYVISCSDSILNWINNYLINPDSVMVMLSEFNATVVMTSLLQTPVDAMVVANMNAGMVYKFGYRAMSVVWDSYEGGGDGPDGTHGALSLFNDYPTGPSSNMGKAPSAAYWGNFLVTNVWLNQQDENNLIIPDSTRSTFLRYYGNTTSNDTRILAINLSPTVTCDVNVNLNGKKYSNVEVFTWGSKEFTWRGTNTVAYAMPNCGPSSYRKAIDGFTAPKLPPKTAMVLRFFDSDSGNTTPQRVLVTCENNAVKDSDTVMISASYRVQNGIIKSISYAMDSAKYVSSVAIDSGFDGSYENSLITIKASDISIGKHTIYIRAESDSASITDTVKLTVSSDQNSIKQLKFSGFSDNRLVVKNLTNGKFYFHYKPSVNGSPYICIYTLTGSLIAKFTSESSPIEVNWNSNESAKHNLSSGTMIVKAGIKGAGVDEIRMIKVIK